MKNEKEKRDMETQGLYQVGDIARECNKSVRAIRLYEEKGLLKPVKRTSGGFRLYDENSLIRVKWILEMQQLGFTLNQIANIARMLDHAETAPEAMKEMRRLFEEKLNALETKQSEIEALSEEIKSTLVFLGACKECRTQASFSGCCSQITDKLKREKLSLPTLIAGLYAPYGGVQYNLRAPLSEEEKGT